MPRVLGRGMAWEGIQGGAAVAHDGQRSARRIGHGVGSWCGPYKQSERPRAAKNMIYFGVPQGVLQARVRVGCRGQDIGGAGCGCVRLAGASGVGFNTRYDQIVWCTRNQNSRAQPRSSRVG